ncbi:MAG: hypothetical protein NW200_05000 [Hyphomonadaceae bacterium]|nr:hypothetical protein [Hyphomonadaceae bacterium]
MMRGLALLVLLAACGAAAPHKYPADARATFAEGCPVGDPQCDCLWAEITRTMTHAEYEAAMARFTKEGLMEPRLTAARLECRTAK